VSSQKPPRGNTLRYVRAAAATIHSGQRRKTEAARLWGIAFAERLGQIAGNKPCVDVRKLSIISSQD
jgi:hypothetical protein